MGCEARRGAGKSLQCLVGLKAGDFAQGLSARGRSLGRLGRLVLPMGKVRVCCYRFIHEAIASVSPFACPRGYSGLPGCPGRLFACAYHILALDYS